MISGHTNTMFTINCRHHSVKQDHHHTASTKRYGYGHKQNSRFRPKNTTIQKQPKVRKWQNAHDFCSFYDMVLNTQNLSMSVKVPRWDVKELGNKSYELQHASNKIVEIGEQESKNKILFWTVGWLLIWLSKIDDSTGDSHLVTFRNENKKLNC